MATRIRRKRRRPRSLRWPKIVFPVLAVMVGLAAAGGIAAAWALNIWNEAPQLSSLKLVQKGSSSAIYAADGSLIGFIRSENVRQPVPASQIPRNLRQATVSIEDKNFWHHGALDFHGIARAAWKDLLAGGEPVEGASTITQQLVRNLYIQNPEQTIRRKLIEAHLAEDLFEAHSRGWILIHYLNTAPYGTVEGQTAVGAEAAAQTYFGKKAEELDLTEAALIAGLPQAPSEYNPFLDPGAALERRNEVLGTMFEQGYISRERFDRARTAGLGLNPGQRYKTIRDPFLYDLVQQQLIKKYGTNTVRNGGLKAYTTIDPRLQEDAEAAVAYCSELGTCYPEGGPATGLASVDPKTGAILALASTEGSEDESQFNYAWQAKRQPGSSFKTYVLTTAIKQGIDPATTYYDGHSPMTLENPLGGTYTVENDEGGGGVMSLEEATWASVNVIYSQLDLDVTPEAVTETAHEMGIEEHLESIPAEAIGGLLHGVTPLEQADGYATLASGGIHHKPSAISKVVFPDGKVDELSEEGDRVLTPGQAYDVTNILKGVITHGTATGYTEIGCSEVAGKTGTSEEESDAWFVGYTPEYSTAVWVGHPVSREPTGFGGPTAGPIWRYYMELATEGECPAFETPSSLPELSAYTEGHATGSSQSYSEYEEEFEPSESEEEEGEREAEEGEEEEQEESEANEEEGGVEEPSGPTEIEGGVGVG